MRLAPKGWILTVLIGLTVCLVACSQQPQTPTVTPAAEKTALRNVDLQWSEAASKRGADAFVRYFADDAIFLPPNVSALTSKAAIQRWASELMSNPGLSLNWQPTKVGVSRGGDMGYTSGTYELKLTGPNGKPVSDQGKYLTVWQKQSDGSWKVLADTFNSSLPVRGVASD